MIGRTIAHYKILDRLGSGGMGEVWLAQDTKLDRKVALKFLPDALRHDPEARERLLREAQAACRLSHPNIVTVHTIESADGHDFIVMEYITGETLADFRRNRDPGIGEILEIVIQIAEGLNKAHAQGIVHRDLKPANILIDDEGRARILDFGLAKFADAAKLTRTGSTLGTAAYMSPEQALGRNVDPRSDLFSLGTILYELITGQLPFRGEHQAAIIYAIANETPEPLARYRAHVPDRLQTLVDKLLEKDPTVRYQSAADLVADLRALKRHGTDATSETATAPSLAVLPFVNMSADPANEFFSDGLSEELITALSRIPNFRVVARTSAFSFKGQNLDVRAIGQKLGVTSVLEGSVRHAGNRLRVTAQLINVADGFHLWSDKYDRDMADVFAIQDEITMKIVDALKVRLVGGVKATAQHADVDLEAYTLYLRGRHFWNQRGEDGLKKAIGCFEDALKIDPDYARAYAGLADSYFLLSDHANVPTTEAYPKAMAAARKALELNPDLAEAHTAHAMLLANWEWDFAGAEREFRRALELNPGYATGHHWYSGFLHWMGRWNEAMGHVHRARELDPLAPMIAIGLSLLLSDVGRYDEGVAAIRDLLVETPNFPPGLLWLGITLSMKGDHAEAVAVLERLCAGREDDLGLADLTASYARAGRSDDAQRTLGKVHAFEASGYVPPLEMASVYAMLGDRDRAFEYLEQAFAVRDWGMAALKVFPRLEPLRADPRFADLVRRVGLPE